MSFRSYRRDVPQHRMCTRCHERWPQDRSGRCRRCQRELGDTTTNFERDQQQVATRRHVFHLPPAPPLPPAPRRTVIINGEEYEVVWP